MGQRAGSWGREIGPAAWAGLALSVVALAALANQAIQPGIPTPSGFAQPPLAVFPGLMAGLLFGSAGVALLWRRRDVPDGIPLFLVAYGLRIGVGVMLALLYQAQDEQGLHRLAMELAAGSGSDLGSALMRGRGYIAAVAVEYRLFGVSLFVPKVVNAFLGSILPFLVYDITRAASGSASAARRALLFTAFLPPLVIFSALNLKEPPSTFMLVLTLWLLLVPRTPFAGRLALGLGATAATFFLRASWALIPLGICGLAVLFRPRSGKREPRRARAVALVVAAVGLAMLLPLGGIIERVDQHAASRLRQGVVASWGAIEAPEGSVTGSLLGTDNPWTFRNVAVQVARVPFAPSPLQPLTGGWSVPAVWISLNAVTQYVLMPLMLIGVLAYRRKRGVLLVAGAEALFLFTVALSLMLGLTLQRHSIPHFALMFVLASLGVEYWRRYTWVIKLWIVAVVGFTLVYVFTKA